MNNEKLPAVPAVRRVPILTTVAYARRYTPDEPANVIEHQLTTIRDWIPSDLMNDPDARFVPFVDECPRGGPYPGLRQAMEALERAEFGVFSVCGLDRIGTTIAEVLSVIFHVIHFGGLFLDEPSGIETLSSDWEFLQQSPNVVADPQVIARYLGSHCTPTPRPRKVRTPIESDIAEGTPE